MEAFASLPPRWPAGGQVFQQDLRDTAEALFPDGHHPRLVIVHPPYFNSYKFSSVNSLELAWLGIDPAEVRQGEIREFFKVGRPEKVESYLEDMSRVLARLARGMTTGAVLALMIGDTVLRGEHIRVVRSLLGKDNFRLGSA